MNQSSPDAPVAQAPPRGVDPQTIASLGQARNLLRKQISQVIVGQDRVIDDLLIVLFAGGHCLMVGLPGMAKTLMVQTIAQAVDLQFGRIQFTPDLMPADITGTDVFQHDPDTGRRAFEFVKGPIFTNILLADEINRTPPKTQAALLEAMQERQVTAGGKTFALPAPFFVLATQNPIEQEGTYPLPEAQLDRFMFMVKVGYPTPQQELQIALTTTTGQTPVVQKVLEAEDIIRLQSHVRQLPVSEHVAMYCVKLARSTRPGDDIAPAITREMVTWGVGPRAIQYLVLGAKAHAALHGKYNVSVDDVKRVAPLVLRHRIIPNFHAETQGVDTDQIVAKLLEHVTEPGPEDYK